MIRLPFRRHLKRETHLFQKPLGRLQPLDITGEFGRHPVVERAVRTALVVIPAPGLQNLLCLGQSLEPVNVQAFIEQ